MKTGTVFVVDNDPAVRESLSLLLEEEGLTVVCFASAAAFLDAYRAVPRSCAIVDLRMPGIDGLQLQDELLKQGIPLPLIFLTGHGNIPQSVRAMKAGAFDFLTKPVTGEVLLTQVDSALRESEALGTQAETIEQAKASVAHLTAREREVMVLAVEGLSNKEIAQRLNISYRTVEIHKARIFIKTGVKKLIDLTRIVRMSGLGH